MYELLKYFKKVRGVESIGDITWAHAVNNIQLLEQAIANPRVDFLEIDISQSKNDEPIAAHYQDESDLSLTHLLTKVGESNKGLKLDFKDWRSIIPCLELLVAKKLDQPIILNADILRLKDAPEAIIESDIFIENCQKYYPKGLLSVGWRTTDNPDSVYSAEDIDKMLATCKDLKNVTFPVKAVMLPGSWENVKRLIEEESYTLTIWNGRALNDELKKWIIKNTDSRKCFYDL